MPDNLNPSVPSVPSVAKNAGRNWGGRRPGAGAPKGNLNALKHGRTSRRQAQLLEAAVEIPQVRQALIDLANRERRRRKKAEEGYGVLMTRLLERVAEIVLATNPDGSNQDHNYQAFLDFLNTTTAEMRKILEKPSSRRRISIKHGRTQPDSPPPLPRMGAGGEGIAGTDQRDAEIPRLHPSTPRPHPRARNDRPPRLRGGAASYLLPLTSDL